ncbi:MAG TPA: type II toxin-antitoxin system prevent-host-death family antitoxin [Planctomycetota bacterium]|nr:type II toxin-antitoxin system prevent-host-death family antitoxin [Planctomycetota bacterium]
MKRVRIADLKARLSEHLRSVRKGHSITVLDRETPIARILPYAEDDRAFVVRKALDPRPPGKLTPPPPLGLPIDVVELLREERGDR